MRTNLPKTFCLLLVLPVTCVSIVLNGSSTTPSLYPHSDLASANSVPRGNLTLELDPFLDQGANLMRESWAPSRQLNGSWHLSPNSTSNTSSPNAFVQFPTFQIEGFTYSGTYDPQSQVRIGGGVATLWNWLSDGLSQKPPGTPLPRGLYFRRYAGSLGAVMFLVQYLMEGHISVRYRDAAWATEFLQHALTTRADLRAVNVHANDITISVAGHRIIRATAVTQPLNPEQQVNIPGKTLDFRGRKWPRRSLPPREVQDVFEVALRYLRLLPPRDPLPGNFVLDSSDYGAKTVFYLELDFSTDDSSSSSSCDNITPVSLTQSFNTIRTFYRHERYTEELWGELFAGGQRCGRMAIFNQFVVL